MRGKRSHLEANYHTSTLFSRASTPLLLHQSIPPIYRKKNYRQHCCFHVPFLIHLEQKNLSGSDCMQFVVRVALKRPAVTPLDPPAQRSGPRQPPHRSPSLMAPACLPIPKTKMGNTCRIGRDVRGERQSRKCRMMVVSQECLRLAHSGRSSSDSSLVLLVRPKPPED